MSEKKELQICGNDEWIRENVLQDYKDVLSESAEWGENCEINFYTDKLLDALKERGFELVWRGSETYHGWNGAMCFAFMSGIVACYKPLTEHEQKLVSEAQDEAFQKFEELMKELQQCEGGES
jgi:hypothetical protein